MHQEFQECLFAQFAIARFPTALLAALPVGLHWYFERPPGLASQEQPPQSHLLMDYLQN
jgi:hypothetical protein